MEVRTFEPAAVPAILDYWNRSFADRPNFFPIGEADFRQRVSENEAGFDPAGLLIALDGSRVAGMAHAGRRAEEGYIAFLHVAPEHRERGLGNRLLAGCRRYLAGSSPVVLDGQCFNPYYGNAQGPFLPFWGTPEGISVPACDEATVRFLSRRGFPQRFEAVSMETSPRIFPATDSGATSYEPFIGSCPRIGGEVSAGMPFTRGEGYLAWAAVLEGRVAGTIVAFSMERAVRGKWGIYELEVADSARGRGIGTELTKRILSTLERRGVLACEVLTIPALSPGAYALYGKLGFQVVRRWAIF